MKNSLLALAVLVFSAGSLGAQTDGTYGGFSPYSVFGLGQMHQSGTSWNRGRGGVGIAARNHRFINILNPASMTARDSLSFMADMGLGGRISVFSEGDKRALNTTFNIDDVAISFPMWRHTAFMVGVTPVSDVGYNISYRDIDVYTQQRQFTSTGNGGTYQLFAAAAATFWNRLSIGAQFNYTFGNISKKSTIVNGDESYRTMVSATSAENSASSTSSPFPDSPSSPWVPPINSPLPSSATAYTTGNWAAMTANAPLPNSRTKASGWETNWASASASAGEMISW